MSECNSVYLLARRYFCCNRRNRQSSIEQKNLVSEIPTLSSRRTFVSEDVVEAKDETNTMHYCSICYEFHPSEQNVKLSTCNHMVCVYCLRSWAASQIGEGLAAVSCPFHHECGTMLRHDDLRRILEHENFIKFDRRVLERTAAADPTLHLCGTADCSYIVSWEGREKDGPPILNCPVCNISQCIQCKRSPYHYGRSCAGQHEDTPQECRPKKAFFSLFSIGRASKKGLTKTDVAAPNALTDSSEMMDLFEEYLKSQKLHTCKRCKIPIEKKAGCDKMKCLCGYKFCYSCGAENATCSCTGKFHGYWDNKRNRGDFTL